MDRKIIITYFKEFFTLAKLEGILFLEIQFRSLWDAKETFKFIKEVVVDVEDNLIDNIILIKKKDTFVLLLGIKSVIGYNDSFKEVVNMQFSDKLSIEIKRIVQFKTKIKFNDFINKMLMAIKKKNEVIMLFAKNNRINILQDIYDNIVIPLMYEDIPINIDFFEQKRWIKNYYPINSNQGYNYAIVNLIRFDFSKNNLIIVNKDIYTKNSINDSFIKYMTVLEYISMLNKLILETRKIYYIQLAHIDLNKMLVENSDNLIKYFEGYGFLPKSEESKILIS